MKILETSKEKKQKRDPINKETNKVKRKKET